MLDPRQKAIFDHYGFHHQLEKLKEECRELIEAVDAFQKEPLLNWTHVEEEMADVLNLIDQFSGRLYARMRIDEIRERKIARQIERMEKEKDAGRTVVPAEGA